MLKHEQLPNDPWRFASPWPPSPDVLRGLYAREAAYQRRCRLEWEAQGPMDKFLDWIAGTVVPRAS